jgi:thiol-disulfide isomerase/thioredoxin
MHREAFWVLLSLSVLAGCTRSKAGSDSQSSRPSSQPITSRPAPAALGARALPSAVNELGAAAPQNTGGVGSGAPGPHVGAHGYTTHSGLGRGAADPGLRGAAEGPASPLAAAEPGSPGAIEPIAIGAFLARLALWGDKATLVNAFASWCGPCREEVPMLEAMAPHLARDGIRVVFVAFDEPEDRLKAESFLRSSEVRSPSFLALDALTFRTRLAPKWPGMIPATFLLDAQQKLRYFWGGPAHEHEILPIVEGFLAGRNIDGHSNFSLTRGRTE